MYTRGQENSLFKILDAYVDDVPEAGALEKEVGVIPGQHKKQVQLQAESFGTKFTGNWRQSAQKRSTLEIGNRFIVESTLKR